MKILFLESFFGGSHKDVALGFKHHSNHDVTLLTLPARFWKWRMRGSALYFLDQIPDISVYDLVIATDMMDLTDFKALAGKQMPPCWFYFHENQLSYPLAPGQKRDSHLGFTNILSAAAADRVIFNSKFHLTDFFIHAEKLIKQMPDYRPAHLLEKIKEKACVIYPGCWFEPVEIEPGKTEPGKTEPGKTELENASEPPLIIWNHRWEHDKNPGPFFKALANLKAKKIPFRLALLGERYKMYPKIFDQATEDFKEELVVFGYAESKDEYINYLKQGAIVVSSSNQENFGISIVEAVRYGCLPLLPNRLSYPELIPEKYHPDLIYQTDSQLFESLEKLVVNFQAYEPLKRHLSETMAQFSWQNIIIEFEKLL